VKTILGLFAALFILFAVLVSLPKIAEVNRAVEKETSPDPKFVALRSAKLDYNWQKGGFGSVMMIDATVTNPSATAFKDFTIKCTHAGPSGTEIDSNTRTIYDIVPSKSKKRFRQINMGFIHSQAARSSCEITDLVLASPAEQAQLDAKAKVAAERQHRERTREIENERRARPMAEAKERANRESMHSKLVQDCTERYKGKPVSSVSDVCSPVIGEINTK